MGRRHALAALAALVVAASQNLAAPPTPRHPSYPPTRTIDTADIYHGTRVPDPYRWLEWLNTPEVWGWVEAQNRLTSMYLEQIQGRDAIRARLAALWERERIGTPIRRGERIFFSRNTGTQWQDVWYVQDTAAGEPRVLLDPDALSRDGLAALSDVSVSVDGTLVAYALSSAGSEWREWHVREVATGRDLPDWVKWAKYSGAAWTADGAGFFYSRYDEPTRGREALANQFHKVYLHRVGTPQSKDALVYQRPDHPDWGFQPLLSDDGRYLVIVVSVGSDRRNLVLCSDLAQPAAPAVELIGELEATWELVGNDGPVFYLRTDSQAPRGRLVAVDVRSPHGAPRREVLREAPETLVAVDLFQDTFVARYLQDASTRVRLFRLDGSPTGEVKLPGIGTASGFTGLRQDAETFYSFTNFTTPAAAYRLDVRSGASTLFRRSDLGFDPGRYVTTQAFCTSKDGTRVPLFISHKQGIKLDGSNPALLHGNGSFSVSLTPSYSFDNLAWMEMGGVLAVANLRGGGEYGESWHRAGALQNKQHTFDDLVAAAESLIKSGYTTPRKLAIYGAGSGGLAVAAAVNQRPDLFGAAVAAHGLMDMLRYHKYTVGFAWTAEYGSADDPAMFPVLRAYSPLHNVKKGTSHPPTLITTTGYDERIMPAHSYKYTAALQAAQTGAAPILLRVEARTWQGAARPTAKIIDEAADRLAFIVRSLGMPTPKGTVR